MLSSGPRGGRQPDPERSASVHDLFLKMCEPLGFKREPPGNWALTENELRFAPLGRALTDPTAFDPGYDLSFVDRRVDATGNELSLVSVIDKEDGSHVLIDYQIGGRLRISLIPETQRGKVMNCLLLSEIDRKRDSCSINIGTLLTDEALRTDLKALTQRPASSILGRLYLPDALSIGEWRHAAISEPMPGDGFTFVGLDKNNLLTLMRVRGRESLPHLYSLAIYAVCDPIKISSIGELELDLLELVNQDLTNRNLLPVTAFDSFQVGTPTIPPSSPPDPIGLIGCYHQQGLHVVLTISTPNGTLTGYPIGYFKGKFPEFGVMF